MTDYALYAILPAMHLDAPVECGRALFCTSDDLVTIQLQPSSDVQAIQQIARQYSNSTGNLLGKIGLLLLPRGIDQKMADLGLPRICRDVVALCHVSGGTLRNAHLNQVIRAHQSDYFDSLPIVFSGNRLSIQRPGHIGAGYTVSAFRPSLPPYLGGMHNCMFELDKPLHEALNRAILLYYQGRHRRELRQIFRAIAVSFHACRMLTETDSTWYDLGTRIVDWVSAFEILVHPGHGQVRSTDVFRLIGDIRWFDRRRSPRATKIGHRRYTYKSKGKIHRENAACHFYRRLYRLRNDFAHGNRLKRSNLVGQASNSATPRVDELAPLLFRECILQRLRQLQVIPHLPTGSMSPQQFRAYHARIQFHDALAIGLGLQR